MDISGGLLAKNIMPSGEHNRCLTCKNVNQAATGLHQATHDSPPTGNTREITLPTGNFYQKENPFFEEQLAAHAADSRPLFARRDDLHKLADTMRAKGLDPGRESS